MNNIKKTLSKLAIVASVIFPFTAQADNGVRSVKLDPGSYSLNQEKFRCQQARPQYKKYCKMTYEAWKQDLAPLNIGAYGIEGKEHLKALNIKFEKDKWAPSQYNLDYLNLTAHIYEGEQIEEFNDVVMIVKSDLMFTNKNEWAVIEKIYFEITEGEESTLPEGKMRDLVLVQTYNGTFTKK